MEVDSENLTEGEETALKEFPSICGNLTEKQIDINLELKSLDSSTPEEDGVIKQFLQTSDDLLINNMAIHEDDDIFYSTPVLNESNEYEDDEFNLNIIKNEAINLNDSMELPADASPEEVNVSIKREGSIDLNNSVCDDFSDEESGKMSSFDDCDMLLHTQEVPHDSEEPETIVNVVVERIDSSLSMYLDDGISTVMNDHNYMSQEHRKPPARTTEEVRHTLIDYLKNVDNVEKVKVDEIVSELMSKLDAFKTRSLCEKDGKKIEGDDREENSEMFSLLVSDSEDISEPSETGTKSDNVQSNQLENARPTEGEISSNSTEKQPEEEEKKDQESQTELAAKVEEDLPTLTKISNFALNLMNSCISFNANATENAVGEFLNKEFKKFKQIISTDCIAVKGTDISIQTEQKFSSKKLRKMNEQDKMQLLLSSSSSGESSSSEDEDSKAHPRRPVEKPAESPVQEKVAADEISEDDDGLDLGRFLESEMREDEEDYEIPQPECGNPREKPKSPSKGIRKKIGERNSLKKSPVKAEVSAEKIEEREIGDKMEGEPQRHANTDAEDSDSDKEIDRLINLDSLSKKKVPVGQYQYPTKPPKPKAAKKNATLSEFDVANELLSDESLSEVEDEVLTEKEFLDRRNENLKKQLLNSSSSESELEDDQQVDLKEIDKSDNEEDSDDGRKSAMSVDDFLKTLNTSDVADEDAKSDHFAEDNSVKDSVDSKDLKEADLESHKSTVIDENSDCEILMDAPKKKQVRVKSLKKLLAEDERRKKNAIMEEDLISLSSESETGTEECEDEPQSKKRYIKPMLRSDQLAGETRIAQKEEADRLKRLEKKNALLAKALKEREKKSPSKETELVLDYCTETKRFIKVHEAIVKHLKPHQFEGIRFMYDSCYSSVNDLKKHSGSGCILAHCMGLGKTLQLIGLLHTVISYKELNTSKVLVLCPKSTVMNWSEEIQRWLGPISTKTLRVFTFQDISSIHEKIRVLKEWSQCGKDDSKPGCLLIGYEAFRLLVLFDSYKKRQTYKPSQVEALQKQINEYLLESGADLVVCDEGHIIKNRKSAISRAVSEIKTRKRIVLTGTPIQNNLKEYYSMVNFIKPLFLGTEKEFANLYANPIKQGQHKDSSKKDIKFMKQRSFVLHRKLSKFVQRKEAALLKTFLPEKFEYVLFVPLTNVQTNLYEYILGAISLRGGSGSSLVIDYTCLRKIWTHPKVLESAWQNAIQNKHKKESAKKKIAAEALLNAVDDDEPDDLLDANEGVMSVTRDWWRSLLSKDDLESIMPSNKLRAMFEILRMCEEMGEKCLIFSAFVAVLNVVEFFLNKINQRDKTTLDEIMGKHPKDKIPTWVNGQDYYRLDGKTPKSIRHEMVTRFNSATNKRARLFLISAKAGGQGINLIGANRVIILDTSWNPSNDQQNIFRVFRLGQKKKCFIYRLLAMGTMEEKVYSRSVTKQAMSFRVVDEQQIDRHYSMAELAELYSLTKPEFSERPVPTIPQDNILANLLRNHPNLVYKYHEHDSLLENKVEQELSEQEKEDAWSAYERDMQNTLEPNNMFGNGMNGMSAGFFGPGMPANYLPQLAQYNARNYPLNYALSQGGLAGNPMLGNTYNYPGGGNPYLELLNMYPNYPALAQSSLMYGQAPNAMSSSFNTNYLASTASMLNLLQQSNTNPLAALNSISSSLSNMNSADKTPRGAANNTPSRSPLLPPYSTSPAPALPSAQATSLGNFSKDLYEAAMRSSEQYSASSKGINGSSSSRMMADLARSISSQAASPTTSIPNTVPTTVSPVISGRQPPITSNKSPLQQPMPPTKALSVVTSPTIPQSPNTLAQALSTQTRTSANSPSIPTSVIKKPEVMLSKTADAAAKSPSTAVSAKNTNYSSSPITVTKITPQSASAANKAVDNRTLNMGIIYPEKNAPKETASASSVNMGIIYPQGQSNSPKTTVKGTPAPKAGSGMQIIATRGLPTGTINKSFEQLSPSISLTAVNPPIKSTTVSTSSPTSGVKITPANMQINKTAVKTPVTIPKVTLPKPKVFAPPKKIANQAAPTTRPATHVATNAAPQGSRIKMMPQTTAVTTPRITSVQGNLTQKVYPKTANTVKVTMNPTQTTQSNVSVQRNQLSAQRVKPAAVIKTSTGQLQGPAPSTQSALKRIELNPTTLAAVKNSINTRPGLAISADASSKAHHSGVFFISNDKAVKSNVAAGSSANSNNSIGLTSGATITRVVGNRKRGISAAAPGMVTIADIKRQRMSQPQVPPKTTQTVSDSLKRVQSTRALTIVQTPTGQQNQKVVNKVIPTEVVEID